MNRNVTTIKNPLTIIAIFAGIVEISATMVLPFIEPEVQAIYIWFLIGFPSFLVAIFFITLNFNNAVLYAPSDFSNDESFLASNNKSIVTDVKIESTPSQQGFTFRNE
ncbi:hypothetical protein M634_22465 [Vibrio parahaemolyticus O1:Kuk str. FDA_R31]|uniref:hypothetical protein n=1 Tax=Vibrio harveyi group TaxID=717610 RepID=UPI0003591D07|nr:hypothetical protein [Vibrio parahaemolyticus]AGQ94067.1 hypothetical protein M634_22465 [Vibrio parahaemolyticus O1:Kuk str. FDA_R31]EGR0313593.1 hypothetical protein [Vibrio parahaemolyticus]EJB0394013.1 hypothetical protein [Vibrio parahaemolyticus]EJB5290069.1 hypothetical protein [Vibrio parahaemolyticus]EJG2015369.1 hypothetical protein [Vibrio parahaemolyticus]